MSTTDATSAVPAAATASIALKIRTLDQKTYPITIDSQASVPELKEAVAAETGVVLDRQRLIFRGKVLKNDQRISEYALEDGHVLHLVVRADPLPASTTSASVSTSSPDANSVEPPPPSTTPAGRTNDDPDPTLGGSQRGNRVVMGATISVPEDVPMPFLSSIITNFVNSMGNAAAGTAPTGGEEAEQNTRRQRRSRRRNRDVNETIASMRSPLMRSGAALTGGANAASTPLGGSMLRSFSENHLRRVEAALANTGFDFQNLSAAELPQDAEGEAASVQQQLRQLLEQIERFRPRMQQLPVALHDIGAQNQADQEAPNNLVSATVSAIDTLQSLGDAASALARFSRHVFLDNSPNLPSPMFRLDDRGGFRASLSIPIMNASTIQGSQTGSAGSNRPSARPRSESSPPVVTSQGDVTQNAGRSGGVLQALYDRVTAGLMGSTQSSSAAEASPAATSASSATSVSGAPTRVTFSTISGPFPPVFPFTVAPAEFGTTPPGARVATTTWDIAGLWNRVAGDMSASSVFGILRGDPTSLHELMSFVASVLLRGTYTPPAARPSVRSWARRFIIEVRRALGAQTIPTEILDLTPDRDQARFIDEVTRPFDSFMPDLVDRVLLANGASRGDAFGQSCVELFHTMATQFLTRMLAYVDQDEAQLRQLFEAILAALGVEASFAVFLVGKFLEWAQPAASSRRAREDQEDAGTITAAKRRRRE